MRIRSAGPSTSARPTTRFTAGTYCTWSGSTSLPPATWQAARPTATNGQIKYRNTSIARTHAYICRKFSTSLTAPNASQSRRCNTHSHSHANAIFKWRFVWTGELAQWNSNVIHPKCNVIHATYEDAAYATTARPETHPS